MDKLLPAQRPNIMSLEFFANRFLVAKEKLSWGVVEIIADYTETIPVIRIDGNINVIDIKRDSLAYNKSMLGKKVTVYPAQLSDDGSQYVLTYPKGHISVDKDEIERLYKNKFVKFD